MVLYLNLYIRSVVYPNRLIAETVLYSQKLSFIRTVLYLAHLIAETVLYLNRLVTETSYIHTFLNKTVFYSTFL